MTKRLTWEEIEGRYNREWVELVDYDWPDEEPDPRAGVVRVHAKTRDEFDNLVAKEPPIDSAFVFVGVPEVDENSVLSTFNIVTMRN